MQCTPPGFPRFLQSEGRVIFSACLIAFLLKTSISPAPALLTDVSGKRLCVNGEINRGRIRSPLSGFGKVRRTSRQMVLLFECSQGRGVKAAGSSLSLSPPDASRSLSLSLSPPGLRFPPPHLPPSSLFLLLGSGEKQMCYKQTSKASEFAASSPLLAPWHMAASARFPCSLVKVNTHIHTHLIPLQLAAFHTPKGAALFCFQPGLHIAHECF